MHFNSSTPFSQKSRQFKINSKMDHTPNTISNTSNLFSQTPNTENALLQQKLHQLQIQTMQAKDREENLQKMNNNLLDAFQQYKIKGDDRKKVTQELEILSDQHLRELNQMKSHFNEQVKKYQLEISTLKQNILSSEEQQRYISSNVLTLQQKDIENRMQIEDLQKNLKQKSEEIEEKQKDICKLKERLGNSNELYTSNKDLINEIERLQAENENLKRDGTKLGQTLRLMFEKQKKELREKNLSLLDEIKLINETNERDNHLKFQLQEKLKEELQFTREQKEELFHNNKYLEREVARFQTAVYDKSGLEHQLKNMQKERSEFREMQQQFRHLKLDHVELVEKFQFQEHEIANLKQLLEQKQNSFENERLSLIDQMNEQQKQVQSMAESYEGAKAEFERKNAIILKDNLTKDDKIRKLNEKMLQRSSCFNNSQISLSQTRFSNINFPDDSSTSTFSQDQKSRSHERSKSSLNLNEINNLFTTTNKNDFLTQQTTTSNTASLTAVRDLSKNSHSAQSQSNILPKHNNIKISTPCASSSLAKNQATNGDNLSINAAYPLPPSNFTSTCCTTMNTMGSTVFTNHSTQYSGHSNFLNSNFNDQKDDDRRQSTSGRQQLHHNLPPHQTQHTSNGQGSIVTQPYRSKGSITIDSFNCCSPQQKLKSKFYNDAPKDIPATTTNAYGLNNIRGHRRDASSKNTFDEIQIHLNNNNISSTNSGMGPQNNDTQRLSSHFKISSINFNLDPSDCNANQLNTNSSFNSSSNAPINHEIKNINEAQISQVSSISLVPHQFYSQNDQYLNISLQGAPQTVHTSIVNLSSLGNLVPSNLQNTQQLANSENCNLATQNNLSNTYQNRNTSPINRQNHTQNSISNVQSLGFLVRYANSIECVGCQQHISVHCFFDHVTSSSCLNKGVQSGLNLTTGNQVGRHLNTSFFNEIYEVLNENNAAHGLGFLEDERGSNTSGNGGPGCVKKRGMTNDEVVFTQRKQEIFSPKLNSRADMFSPAHSRRQTHLSPIARSPFNFEKISNCGGGGGGGSIGNNDQIENILEIFLLNILNQLSTQSFENQLRVFQEQIASITKSCSEKQCFVSLRIMKSKFSSTEDVVKYIYKIENIQKEKIRCPLQEVRNFNNIPVNTQTGTNLRSDQLSNNQLESPKHHRLSDIGSKPNINQKKTALTLEVVNNFSSLNQNKQFI